MSHPRATFPLQVIADVERLGLRRACAEYRTSHNTLRRWLVERGISIRRPGRQIRRGVRLPAAAVDA